MTSAEEENSLTEGTRLLQQRFVLWYLSLAACLVTICFIAFFSLYDPVGTRPALVVSAIALVIYSTGFLEPVRRRPRFGGFLLTGTIVVHLSFGLAFFGTGSGLQTLFLVVVALFSRILASENRPVIVGWLVVVGLLLVSGVMVFPPERALIPLPPDILVGMHMASSAIAVTLVGGFALWAREHTGSLERRLRQSNRNLQDLARSDALTGLLNRRGLLDVLGHEWARGRRDGSPLAVLMIDIDHFKPYNDHYGHPAGDVCLERFSRVLESTVHRPADVAARYGGEEFVLVLPGTNREGAARVADRVLERLAGERIPHGCPPAGPYLTASIGACVMIPDANNDPGMLVYRADEGLYRAKRAGRNRVEMN